MDWLFIQILGTLKRGLKTRILEINLDSIPVLMQGGWHLEGLVPYQDFAVQSSLEKLEDTLPVLGEAGREMTSLCREP